MHHINRVLPGLPTGPHKKPLFPHPQMQSKSLSLFEVMGNLSKSSKHLVSLGMKDGVGGFDLSPPLAATGPWFVLHEDSAPVLTLELPHPRPLGSPCLPTQA